MRTTLAAAALSAAALTLVSAGAAHAGSMASTTRRTPSTAPTSARSVRNGQENVTVTTVHDNLVRRAASGRPRPSSSTPTATTTDRSSSSSPALYEGTDYLLRATDGFDRSSWGRAGRERRLRPAGQVPQGRRPRGDVPGRPREPRRGPRRRPGVRHPHRRHQPRPARLGRRATQLHPWLSRGCWPFRSASPSVRNGEADGASPRCGGPACTSMLAEPTSTLLAEQPGRNCSEAIHHRAGDPGASNLTPAELADIAKASNDVVDGPDVPYTWVNSYVAGDKIYSGPRDRGPETVLEHARRGASREHRRGGGQRVRPHTAAMAGTAVAEA